MVRIVGLEPTQDCSHWLLRPARIPIPPHPHWDRVEGSDPGPICTLRIRSDMWGGHYTHPYSQGHCICLLVLTYHSFTRPKRSEGEINRLTVGPSMLLPIE